MAILRSPISKFIMNTIIGWNHLIKRKCTKTTRMTFCNLQATITRVRLSHNEFIITNGWRLCLCRQRLASKIHSLHSQFPAQTSMCEDQLDMKKFDFLVNWRHLCSVFLTSGHWKCFTISKFSHARWPPACQEQSGWGVLLRDTSKLS